MSARRGFTLVEVVVAIAVGSVLLLAVYAVLASAQTTAEQIAQRTRASRAASAAFSLLASDLAAATLYHEGEIGFAGATEASGLARFDCLTLAPSVSQLGDRSSRPTEVGYLAFPAPGEGNLYRLYRREQVLRDGQPTRGGRLEPLCDGVARFRARYHDGTGWQDAWKDRKTLPQRVEVTLVLRDRASGTEHEFIRSFPIVSQGLRRPALDAPPAGGEAGGEAGGGEAGGGAAEPPPDEPPPGGPGSDG